MLLLALGLIIFFAAHSTRIVAEQWRISQIETLGEQRWKSIVSLLSLLGFVLIVWGYDDSRGDSPILWPTPIWSRHLAALLTLPTFVLLAAAYVPGNRIKPGVGHPMLLATVFWALAHLLANGKRSDLLLFGSFLLWAVADLAAARRRDRGSGKNSRDVDGTLSRDFLSVAVGILAWSLFVWFVHGWLFGVAPLG